MPRIKRKGSIQNNAKVSFATSIADIDPEGSITNEVKLIKRIQKKHEQKSKVPTESATLASIHDGWNKVQDENNNNTKNVNRSNSNSFADLLDLAGNDKRKKSTSFVNDVEKEKPVGVSRSNSLIWTRMQKRNREHFSDQMQQMFEKFGVPYEPPALKKSNSRGKRIKSNESLPLNSGAFNTPKTGKEKPFSNVSSKVDTRWKQLDVFRHIFKLSNQNLSGQQSANADSKTKSKTTITGRPSILKLRKNSILKSSENQSSAKPKLSRTERLVVNYPALETVKNVSNKLPLTIAPKYNTKKVLELTREPGKPVVGEAWDNVDSPPASTSAPDKSSPEERENTPANFEHRRLRPRRRFNIGDFLRGSLFDMKQLEKDETETETEKGDKNNTCYTVENRCSTNMLRRPVSDTDPPQSSIQAQPTAFLTTKISVRRRLNQIPTFGDYNGLPKSPKLVFVQTKEISELPMSMNIPRLLKRFPIPWRYTHNHIMPSNEKKAFPLTKKARQRKITFAFAYANRVLTDDDGASSPINLLNRSSVAELEPAEDGSVKNAFALKSRKSSTQVVNSMVLTQKTSSSQVVNSILLNKNSNDSLCSSGGRRSRSGSKYRIRFSEENFTRGEKDFNGNSYRSTSQASLSRSSSASVSDSSSKSSLKGSKQKLPKKSRSNVSTNKKRPAPVLKEFKRLQQSLNGLDTDIDEIDLISPRSFHNVTEAISVVNETVMQGIVDIVKTVANLFTFSLFRHEENVEPTNSASTTSTNDTTS